MNERPTPETDAEFQKLYAGYPTHPATLDLQLAERFARKLERQLAQARADDDRNNQLMVELMRQRDELLAALERVLASATPNPRDNPAMYPVWESARASIAAVKGSK